MANNCWIIVGAKDHVSQGINGGFIQANHGKRTALDRMKPGDRITFYSPKEFYDRPGRLQAFTALATVSDGPVYQVDMGDGFEPFRRDVVFEPVTEVPLMSILDQMDFIRNKKSYGAVFRFGVVKVPPEDFAKIEAALRGR